MYPISPNQPNTWPPAAKLHNSHVLLLDVSVPQKTRETWFSGGVISIKCIDHHASAVEHWPAHSCPINTASCASLQTWQTFYPNTAIPHWLHYIDRIDRWDNPTYEDRCLREVLNIIAHKPVQKLLNEAFALTEEFLYNISTPQGIASLIAYGKTILDPKDAALMTLLGAGSLIEISQQHLAAWKLHTAWLGKSVFIIENTNVPLDTTEAAHIVFHYYPNISAFVNYRKKMVHDKEMYVYCARSRGFDLTHGGFLKGHPTAAGTSIIKTEHTVLPFVVAPMAVTVA